MKSLNCLAIATTVVAARDANAEIRRNPLPMRDGIVFCEDLARDPNFDNAEELQHAEIMEGRSYYEPKPDEMSVTTVRRGTVQQGDTMLTAICEYERKLFLRTLGTAGVFTDLLDDLRTAVPTVKGVHVCLDAPGVDSDKCFRDRYTSDVFGELPEDFGSLTPRIPDGLVDPGTGSMIDITDWTAMDDGNYYSLFPRGEKFTGSEFANKQLVFRDAISLVRQALARGNFVPTIPPHPKNRGGNR